MRFIIYGVGAIGGTFAAALALAGHEVIGIARGKMLDAIRANKGLLFRTQAGSQHADFPTVAAPGEITFRPDDAIFLCMKGQDTLEALEALRSAGVSEQAIVCAQNGVNNERLALRLFPNVYAMTVMLPADYLVPGEVACYAAPKYGITDLGRYPHGLDETVAEIATALDSANFAAVPMEHVMQSKYGKLIENLGNVVEAALGHGTKSPTIIAAITEEAKAVYRASGITWIDIGGHPPRRQGVMEMGPVEGAERKGGSSTQSLKRGTGSIETDYLNGEIALLGRLAGVPTPLNAALTAVSQELIAKGAGPGSLGETELKAKLGL
jgi:2-dehydropantoate 2-reductase